MTITYLEKDNLIKVEANEIKAFSLAAINYLSVTVASTINCKNIVSSTLGVSDVLTTTSDFYIASGVLYMKASAFKISTFNDGIYKVAVKLTKETGHTLIENCVFIDVSFRCQVAGYLQGLIEENKNYSKSDKISTIIHLLHYGLVNGSNCGCNCEEMCQVFDELKTLLDTNIPQNKDCGC